MRLWAAAVPGSDFGTPESSVKITILPRGLVRHASTYGGWPMAVHNSFKQRKEAFDLLGEVCSLEVQRLLALANQLPTFRRLPRCTMILPF